MYNMKILQFVDYLNLNINNLIDEINYIYIIEKILNKFYINKAELIKNL